MTCTRRSWTGPSHWLRRSRLVSYPVCIFTSLSPAPQAHPELTKENDPLAFCHLGETKQRVRWWRLEMQSSGPAAGPGPKFRPGRAFCGARPKSAGLMRGSEEAITMYYVLEFVYLFISLEQSTGAVAIYGCRQLAKWPGFVRCLKDCGRARCRAQ